MAKIANYTGEPITLIRNNNTLFESQQKKNIVIKPIGWLVPEYFAAYNIDNNINVQFANPLVLPPKKEGVKYLVNPHVFNMILDRDDFITVADPVFDEVTGELLGFSRIVQK